MWSVAQAASGFGLIPHGGFVQFDVGALGEFVVPLNSGLENGGCFVILKSPCSGSVFQGTPNSTLLPCIIALNVFHSRFRCLRLATQLCGLAFESVVKKPAFCMNM